VGQPNNARVTAVAVVHQLLPDPFGSVDTTAIDKRAVSGRVEVGPLGVGGDTQCDRANHGGRDQAVYAYADEDAAWWSRELGRGITPGLFGENLRTSGVDITGAEIGERWQIGDGPVSLVVEVTGPRVPCQTFQYRMGEPQWVKRFTAYGAPGAYLRVVQPGGVVAGDPVTVVHRPGHGVTLGQAFLSGDPSVMRRLLAAADGDGLDLSPKMRQAAQRVVAQSHGRAGRT
jgi:MOSC domain-containing protein YiiM